MMTAPVAGIQSLWVIIRATTQVHIKAQCLRKRAIGSSRVGQVKKVTFDYMFSDVFTMNPYEMPLPNTAVLHFSECSDAS